MTGFVIVGTDTDAGKTTFAALWLAQHASEGWAYWKPLETGESDTEAVRFGFEEAARRGAELRVLHAWSKPRMPGRLQLPPHEAQQASTAASELVAEAVLPLALVAVR